MRKRRLSGCGVVVSTAAAPASTRRRSCSGSAESSGGVASIEKSEALDTSNKVSSEINLPTSQSVQPPNRNDDEDSNTNTRSSSENIVVEEDLTDEEITTKFAEIFAGIGIHPMDLTAPVDEQVCHNLINLASSNNKVVVMSEIGLDFMEGTPDRAIQYQAFRMQIRVARSLKLPIVFFGF